MSGSDRRVSIWRRTKRVLNLLEGLTAQGDKGDVRRRRSVESTKTDDHDSKKFWDKNGRTSKVYMVTRRGRD